MDTKPNDVRVGYRDIPTYTDNKTKAYQRCHCTNCMEDFHEESPTGILRNSIQMYDSCSKCEPGLKHMIETVGEIK